MNGKNIGKAVKAGKKTLEDLMEESPEFIQKFLRAAKGESDDAVTKLGSGKNLKALQDAKINAPTMDAPAYPKNIQQDDLGQVSKDFKLIGEPQTKDFTMPEPGAQLPALRTQTMPSVVETTAKVVPDINPFKVGQAAPQSLGDVAGSMQGQLDDVLNPGMSKMKKAALVAGGLGAGALGLGLMDDEQAAPAAEVPVSGGQTLSDVKAAELPKSPNPIKPAGESSFKASNLASNLKDSYGAPAAPAEQAAPDFAQLLMSAQQNQASNSLMNNLLKAGQTIGSGLAHNKADYSVADSLQGQAGQDVQNVIQQMKSKKDQTELTDDKTLRDSKSDVSKAFRATLAKLGIPHTEKTTAWDAKAMGINPQNLLMQDRSLEKQMAMMDHKNRKETDSFVTGAQKTLLKPFKEYQKVANARTSLDGYLKGESSGPKDVAILYDFIKGLDPESAVKEGEIELARQGMSLFEKYGIEAKKLTQSDILSPKFRAAISEIMKDKEAQARATYEDIAQPFKLHGASRGLDEADYGKFDYLSAADAKKALAQEPKSVVQDSAPKAGGMVKVTRISDGASKMMTAEQAARADKSKYTVGQ